jgi:hypothetical protein
MSLFPITISKRTSDRHVAASQGDLNQTLSGDAAQFTGNCDAHKHGRFTTYSQIRLSRKTITVPRKQRLA